MEDKEEKLARAISASSRRKILHLLIEKERGVKEISQLTKISLPLASKHLKLLYDLGFLKVKVQPPHKFYSLKIKNLKILLDAYEKVVKEL